MKNKMQTINPATVIKLIGLFKALMDKAGSLVKPDRIDDYITTPEENKTQYYIVVLKAAFTKREDAENFKEFNQKLDNAIGEL